MRRFGFLVVALAVTVTGCDQSKAKLEAALAEQQALSAEKDSLMTEILETSKFVTDVNSELAKVKGLEGSPGAGDPGVPGAAKDREQRQQALTRIQTVLARLDSQQTSLGKTETRLKELTRRNSRLANQLADYKKSLGELRTNMERQQTELTAIIDSQRTQITALAGRVDTLVVERQALADTVGQLTVEKNTAFWAAGKESALREQGLVRKEGSKFLIFGGTSLHPTRNPDENAFTRIDLTQETSIALPDSAKWYKVVSPQNLDFVDTMQTQVKDGKKVRGTLVITDARRFWGPSKFLILVED
jgi:hypothetical protein